MAEEIAVPSVDNDDDHHENKDNKGEKQFVNDGDSDEDEQYSDDF